MIRLPPRSTRTDTLFPYTTLFRATAKDGFGAGVFLILFAILLFYAPNYLGHPDNYIEANPLSTPAHIVPEWYFWPFYAILRAFTVDFFFVPAKLLGRSEERRVGNVCVSTCVSRWSPDH